LQETLPMGTPVHASLLDNFKTFEVIQWLVELVQECNKYMSVTTESKPKPILIQKIAVYVTQILRMFGVVQGNEQIGFGAGDGDELASETGVSSSSKEDIITPYVNAFVEFRESIRKTARNKTATASDFLGLCDTVRDSTLAGLGIRVEDSQDASVWKMDDPAVIRKEVLEKQQKAAEAAAKKLETKLQQLQTDYQKAVVAQIPPLEYFRQGPSASKYGSFDETTGMPLTMAAADGTDAAVAGEPVTKSQLKALAKEIKNHEKAHAKLVSTAGEQGIAAYLEGLQKEIAQVQQQVEQQKREMAAAAASEPL